MSSPPPVLTVFTLDQPAAAKYFSLSPFATKLLFRLRHSGVPYAEALGRWEQSPKKKIPYVRFHASGELMADSGIIIATMVRDGTLRDLAGADVITPRDRAVDLAVRTMLEERLYWYTIYERWHMAYGLFLNHGVFAHLPWGLRHLMTGVLGTYAKATLFCQGTGRHSRAEVVGFMTETAEALDGLARSAWDEQLQRTRTRAGGPGSPAGKDGAREEPFWILGGEEPTEVDFCLFGNLAGIGATVVNPVMTGIIKEQPALVEYVRRIHARYFDDYECPM